jgi:hypothetical protein
MDEKILQPAKTFLNGPVMQKTVTSMSIEEIAHSYYLLHGMEKAMKERKEELRQQLLPYVEKHGKHSVKGGYYVILEGLNVLRESRRDSTPDLDALKKMLATKGLKVEDCFDAVSQLQFNPTKLAFLIETGKLNEDEVEDLHRITLALKVQPAKGE